MKNIYIIGDVHGCYKTLLALINKLPNKFDSKICFVGDLIDRGSNSKEIIKLIRDNNYDCVLGNHESYMIDSLEKIIEDNSLVQSEKWTLKAGGIPTIKSYDNTEDILDDMYYLKTLPLFLEYKDYKTNDNRYLVVSHSSVEAKWIYKDFSIDSKEYKELQNSVLNGRYKNFDNKDVFNVYGHTPVNNVTSNLYQANIDLGCCYSKEQMLDPRLCALAFPSMKVYTQENIEEV